MESGTSSTSASSPPHIVLPLVDADGLASVLCVECGLQLVVTRPIHDAFCAELHVCPRAAAHQDEHLEQLLVERRELSRLAELTVVAAAVKAEREAIAKFCNDVAGLVHTPLERAKILRDLAALVLQGVQR